MRATHAVVVVAVAVACSGCDKTHSSLSKMQAAACAGDSDKFFAQVDMPAFEASLRNAALDGIANDKSSPGHLAVLGKERRDLIAENGVRGAISAWRTDIEKLREKSGWCLMTFGSSERIGDRTRVIATRESGGKSYVWFSADGKLVEFRSVDEPRPPGSATP